MQGISNFMQASSQIAHKAQGISNSSRKANQTCITQQFGSSALSRVALGLVWPVVTSAAALCPSSSLPWSPLGPTSPSGASASYPPGRAHRTLWGLPLPPLLRYRPKKMGAMATEAIGYTDTESASNGGRSGCKGSKSSRRRSSSAAGAAAMAPKAPACNGSSAAGCNEGECPRVS